MIFCSTLLSFNKQNLKNNQKQLTSPIFKNNGGEIKKLGPPDAAGSLKCESFCS